MPIHYHEETKHHHGRYARGPGYMDWANQPHPFRRYGGATLLPFPFDGGAPSPTYEDLFVPGSIPPRGMDRFSVGKLFEFSLALSAWKEYAGNRWALRCNPSSGNLHPAEGYLIAGPIESRNLTQHSKGNLESIVLFSFGNWEKHDASAQRVPRRGSVPP